MGASDSKTRGPIVGCLRQQPPEIDAVGRGELETPTQRSIRKRLLDQALAIIKAAAYREAAHIAAPAGQLLLLGGRDQPFGIQHRDFNAVMAVKRRRHRAAGVARGGDQNLQRPARSKPQPSDRCDKETRAEILEGRGGAVKQLQYTQALRAVEPDLRGWEVERLARHRLKLGLES